MAALFVLPCAAQPRPKFTTDVNIVRVPCVVTDRAGAIVHDLRREAFEILEDGAVQEVKYLWKDDALPLSAVLVNDSSCFSRKFALEHKTSMAEFVNRLLSPENRFSIVWAQDQAWLVADSTNSAETLHTRIRRPFIDPQPPVLGLPSCTGKRPAYMAYEGAPCGTKVLWNAVYFAAGRLLQAEDRQNIIVLFGDGRDSGSDFTLAEAISACQRANAMVYCVRTAEFQWADFGKPDLKRIARETGGAFFEASKQPLTEILERVGADLRGRYVLGYTPPAGRFRSAHRKIRVRVMRPGLTVRAREGYYSR
jgi:Ca-activated chloride channel family protein